MAAIIVILAAERLAFNTTRLNVDIQPAYLHASSSSSLTVKVYPVNMLGFRNLFGSAEVRFEVEEGANLIEVLEVTESSVWIRSKGVEGEAIIGIYSLRSGLQISRVLINVYPLDKASLKSRFSSVLRISC